VEQVKALNEFIGNDESLGEGFKIGHSYFCTDEEITDE
jgi:5-methylcytosine-specific restriction protein B